ncbi:MAG: YjbQ family protein [Thermoplasmata archaeon]|nr:YjbQ family protein [Euryarchaeota archaeon]RLF65886.1 MAG: YjbQ family protein [Thermoplasmata archaeon]
MPVYTKEIMINTKGEGDIIDITDIVHEAIAESNIKNGIGLVFVPGSTGAITTIEYEPGLQKDLRRTLDRLFPRDIPYEHEKMWHDGNGHSHIRASFIGPDLAFPIKEGKPVLGVWQQIVFLELDIRPRTRKIIIQIVGE